MIFSNPPSPNKKAATLVRTMPDEKAAYDEALKHLNFAQDYGVPGEERYWQRVLRALESKRAN